jgi:hypothetical protein
LTLTVCKVIGFSLSGKMNKILTFIFPLLFLSLFITLSSPVVGQVKLSDRKSMAFKESKKNKNKKQRKRIQAYRKTSKQNQTQSMTDLVPKGLQEQYVPKDQNAEKNPSKAFSNIEKKEKKTMARKAAESQRQGMNLGLTAKGQLNKARKQSKMISKHQGEIPFVPLALREKPGALPQPEADKNPAKSSRKIRNAKLNQYSQKSEEAQYQGMTTTNPKTNKKDQYFSSRSKEGLYQGQVKSLGKEGERQVSFSQSIVQSQYQGNVQLGANKKEALYARKSRQAKRSGLKHGLNVNQKEAEYMAKSVELQGQGMIKSKSGNRQNAANPMTSDQGSIKGQSLKIKESNQIGNSVAQSQFQGNLKGFSSGKIRAKYAQKSQESLDQGMMKGISKTNNNQELMSKSIPQSQFQGNLTRISPGKMRSERAWKSKETLDQGTYYGITHADRIQESIGISIVQSQYKGDIISPGKKTFESQYIKKNIQDARVGLISGLTVQQKEAGYMAKSVEGLGQGIVKVKRRNLPGAQFLQKSLEAQDQGMMKRTAANTPGSRDAQKSKEALDQGMMKGTTKKGNDQELISKSIPQSLFEGNIKVVSAGKIKAGYANKSAEALRQGMIKGDTKRGIDQEIMTKSIPQTQFGGNIKGYSAGEIQANYANKSAEALGQGMLKGRSKKRQQQELQANSTAKSQFEGNITGNLKNREESKYIRKSQEALNSGMISGLTVQQMEAAYMAKSIEGLSQGLRKGYSTRKIESQYIRKSMEILDQGMVKGKTMLDQNQESGRNSKNQARFQGNISAISGKKMKSIFEHRSQEVLDQGMIKGNTKKENDQELMSKSIPETQFQGNISAISGKKMKSIFARKSQEALDQGMMKGTSKQGLDQELMSKSKPQTLFQGNISGFSSKNIQSGYSRKSNEAQKAGLIAGLSARKIERIMKANQSLELKQGLVKGLSKKDKEQIDRSANMMLSLYQGEVKSLTKANLTSRYIRQSIQIQKAGLIKGKSERSIASSLKQKSNDVAGYRGDERSYTATISILNDWKDRRSQAKNLKMIGDFKVKPQLLADINNLRTSYRQSKYYGMDRETNVERWWAALWKKPIDQRKAPAPLRKPRYDPHEREIWNY